MPVTKVKTGSRIPAKQSIAGVSDKVDKLADALANFESQSRAAFLGLTQEIAKQFSGPFAELKEQVEQHSAELVSLKSDVSKELQEVKARLAQLESAGASATSNGFSGINGGSSGNLTQLAREISLRAEKARERIVCFPPSAPTDMQKQVLEKLHNKPEVAGTWSDSKGREFTLLRWSSPQAAHSAFPMGLFKELRERNIFVNPSLTREERQHERDVSASVAQLFRDDPRMGARYSAKTVTVYERSNNSSRIRIDTAAFTKETLPSSLRDPRLLALLREAKERAGQRTATTTPAQQPRAPAATAPAPAPAPATAPAPAPAPTTGPAPAPAPAPAAAPASARTNRAGRAPQQAQRASIPREEAVEPSSDGSDSDDELLTSRRAMAGKRKQQPKQQKQQKLGSKSKRAAAASPATATKPARKRASTDELPLSNRFSALDDILGGGDQAAADYGSDEHMRMSQDYCNE